MDELTLHRLTHLLASYKKHHGRDISEVELVREGFNATDIGRLVRKGVLDKYQVTNAKGSQENRYKLHRDWRSLNTHA